jgi:hypothetical protein
MSHRLPGFVLCLILTYIAVIECATCNIYNECNICAANGMCYSYIFTAAVSLLQYEGCAWCAATQECQPVSANSTNCGCLKTGGTQCSNQVCSSYNLCYGCVAGGMLKPPIPTLINTLPLPYQSFSFKLSNRLRLVRGLWTMRRK